MQSRPVLDLYHFDGYQRQVVALTGRRGIYILRKPLRLCINVIINNYGPSSDLEYD